MAPQKPDFHSTDPGDHTFGGGDPLDQSNEKPEIACRIGESSSSVDVRTLRKRMGFSQREFAGYFGFALATLRHWEAGNRKPAGTALVLLHVIRDNPRAVLRAVRKARTRDPASVNAIEPYKSQRAPPGFGDRPPPLWKVRRRPR